MDPLDHDHHAYAIVPFIRLQGIMNIEHWQPLFDGMANQTYPPELQINTANVTYAEPHFSQGFRSVTVRNDSLSATDSL